MMTTEGATANGRKHLAVVLCTATLTCAFCMPACGGDVSRIEPDTATSGPGGGYASSGTSTGPGGPDCGQGGDSPTWGTPCQATFFDAVLDSERRQIFLSFGIEGRVQVVSLDDGSV